MKKPLLKISIKSVDTNINNYLLFILKTIKKFSADSRRVHLPTKTKKITLLKSPHVNKKAREQFKTNILKKVIFLEINTKIEKTLKLLILNKPKFIKINMRRII